MPRTLLDLPGPSVCTGRCYFKVQTGVMKNLLNVAGEKTSALPSLTDVTLRLPTNNSNLTTLLNAVLLGKGIAYLSPLGS